MVTRIAFHRFDRRFDNVFSVSQIATVYVERIVGRLNRFVTARNLYQSREKSLKLKRTHVSRAVMRLVIAKLTESCFDRRHPCVYVAMFTSNGFKQVLSKMQSRKNTFNE